MASLAAAHISPSQSANDEQKDAETRLAELDPASKPDSKAEEGVREDGSHSGIRPREKLKKVDKLRTRQFRYAKSTREKNKTPTGSFVISLARIFTQMGKLSDEVEVIIRGNYLREVLEKFYENVEGISFSEEEQNKTTAQQIFHARKYVSHLLEEEKMLQTPNEDKIYELEAAIELIEHRFGGVISELRSLREDRITYPLLWTMFPPNTIVYHLDMIGEPRAYRVLSVSYVEANHFNPDSFDVRCEYVDSNGQNTGFAMPEVISISVFPGILNVNMLSLFPLDRHQDAETLKAQLIYRGQKANSLCGQKIQNYSGLVVGDWDYRLKRWEKFSIEGRIMLDPDAMEQTMPNHKLNLKIAKPLRKDELCSEHFLLWNSKLRGFSLKQKQWGAFAVDRLQKVDWDNNAFECLILQPRKKDFIQDLIMAHGSNSTRDFSDIISGKGRSLIGLLSGPPGVGKTLTAEAIAELTEKPLYKLSSGELGDTPSLVQKRLIEVLKLTELWKAVLLLDEADVFLAARTKKSLTQTAITSIFLKELEYFSGILLLTTNRLENIDDAFHSRIHFHFEYQELIQDTRTHIWRQFIDKISNVGVPKVKICDADIIELAKMDLNARQIKNVLRISQLVAQQRKTDLSLNIIELAADFNDWSKQSATKEIVDLM